ncbi:MAG: hypothetical protein J0M08_08285 [Bacteroidetes bacterium]|nr:hypothetical protein [Bacteroidota bacterium]
MSPKKILLVTGPDRKDNYDFLSKDTYNDYYILWHETNNQLNVCADFIKENYFWKDYKTPFEFIDSVNPDVIVFFEIYDIKQIALCIAAKKRGIKTFYLNHGAASNIQFAISINSELRKRNFFEKVKKIFSKPIGIIINLFFYYSTLFSIKKGNRFKFCVLPFHIFWSQSFHALHRIYFEERIPQTFIIFCRNSYLEAQYQYHCTQENVIYTGVPNFDSYFVMMNDKKALTQSKVCITFVDHPYLEVGWRNWTPEFHKKMAFSLNAFAIKNNLSLFIKLHPRSDKRRWESYGLSKDNITLLQFEDCLEYYHKSALIIGYSSSIMTGFLSARKNVVLVGWNPQPEIIGFDFSQHSICHSSLDINDLDTKFEFWIRNNLAEKNENEYANFIEQNNFPFDGKATQRIINCINQ